MYCPCVLLKGTRNTEREDPSFIVVMKVVLTFSFSSSQRILISLKVRMQPSSDWWILGIFLRAALWPVLEFTTDLRKEGGRRVQEREREREEGKEG